MLVLQDTPAGVPNILQPNPEKVDLPHFQADIKKFQVADVFKELFSSSPLYGKLKFQKLLMHSTVFFALFAPLYGKLKL